MSKEVIQNQLGAKLHGSLDFKIHGGIKLHGKVDTNYSKNGAMGLLCAAILNKGKTTLNGIPRIEEVNRIVEVLTSIGFDINWIGPNSLLILVKSIAYLKS